MELQRIPMAPNPEFDLALNKTKIALMSKADSAFFASIAFSFRHHGDDTVPTACTNGKWVKYNPTWFLSLNPEERLFLMIHEVMHPAYLHLLRKADRDAQVWNMACDYVINLMLVERGFKMPSCGLLDHRFAGMHAEQVYKILMDEAQPPPPGMIYDLVDPDETDEKVIKREIEDILVRASIRSKQEKDNAGTIPGDIQILLDKLTNPKLPWNVILRKYLNGFSKNDYSFRRLNRRFFPQYYIPSLYSESLETVSVAVDTSGSVSQEDFQVFVSEIGSIFRMMKPRVINTVQFDTRIKSVDKVRSFSELLKVKFVGRGGTSIGPVIEWVNGNPCQVLIVFTDGYFGWPAIDTKTPVIWMIHNNPDFVAPFGKVIHYEINNP